MAGVFLSYRRSDAKAEAEALHAWARATFPDTEVFWDMESIEGASDFRAVIHATLRRCNAVLVLIGPTWAEATDRDGRKRLDAEVDFVRAEIEEALRRNIAVIPILLPSTMMPEEADLPRSIKALAYRNAIALPDKQKLEVALRDRLRKKVIDLRTFSVASGAALLSAAVVVAIGLAGSILLGAYAAPLLDSVLEGGGVSNPNSRISGDESSALALLLIQWFAPVLGAVVLVIYATGRLLEQRFKNLSRLIWMMVGYTVVMSSSVVNIAYEDGLLGYDTQFALDLLLIAGSVCVLREFWESVTYNLVTRVAKTLLTAITVGIGIVIPGYFATAYLMSKLNVAPEMDLIAVLPWAITLASLTLASLVYARR